MHRRVRATPRRAERGGRTQAPRLDECGQRNRRGNPLEVISGVWRLDRQRIPFGDGAAELASPVAIGALAGSGLRGGVVRSVMRGLGGGVERPGRAGADHPANRHRDGQNRCQPRMPAFHAPTNTPCPPPGQVRAFPRSEGAPPSIGNPGFGFEGKVPSLQAFPPERGRPALDWDFPVRFRGQGALAPRVSSERGRPALDWDSPVRFRGQVALAPGVSSERGRPALDW